MHSLIQSVVLSGLNLIDDLLRREHTRRTQEYRELRNQDRAAAGAADESERAEKEQNALEQAREWDSREEAEIARNEDTEGEPSGAETNMRRAEEAVQPLTGTASPAVTTQDERLESETAAAKHTAETMPQPFGPMLPADLTHIDEAEIRAAESCVQDTSPNPEVVSGQGVHPAKPASTAPSFPPGRLLLLKGLPLYVTKPPIRSWLSWAIHRFRVGKDLDGAALKNYTVHDRAKFSHPSPDNNFIAYIDLPRADEHAVVRMTSAGATEIAIEALKRWGKWFCPREEYGKSMQAGDPVSAERSSGRKEKDYWKHIPLRHWK